MSGDNKRANESSVCVYAWIVSRVDFMCSYNTHVRTSLFSFSIYLDLSLWSSLFHNICVWYVWCVVRTCIFDMCTHVLCMYSLSLSLRVSCMCGTYSAVWYVVLCKISHTHIHLLILWSIVMYVHTIYTYLLYTSHINACSFYGFCWLFSGYCCCCCCCSWHSWYITDIRCFLLLLFEDKKGRFFVCIFSPNMCTYTE